MRPPRGASAFSGPSTFVCSAGRLGRLRAGEPTTPLVHRSAHRATSTGTCRHGFARPCKLFTSAAPAAASNSGSGGGDDSSRADRSTSAFPLRAPSPYPWQDPAPHPHPSHAMDLSAQDRAMIRLFIAGCFHYWDQLPDLAREYYATGASLAQLRGCVRHLVIFAGYGPCLAATLTLHKAKLLPEDTPGKVDGPPGNAFELVYTDVTDKVRANMHAADPVLGEWIRLHLYGDIYSSPGLDLRQKQLLACAFLAEANMPDQLFGHALAGLRFGNSYDALDEAVHLSIAMSPRPAGTPETADVEKKAVQMLKMAYAKYQKDMAGQPPFCPEVEVSDPEANICIPPLPPLYHTESQQQTEEPGAAGKGDASASISVGKPTVPGSSSSSKAGSGWGTSNLSRPTSLAVDVIAARMEQQRARSGLFFSWPDSPPQEGLQ